MPRSVRKTSLETRTARLSNPIRRAPYYVKIAKGLHLGYDRGAALGSGVAQRDCGVGNNETEEASGRDLALRH